MNSSWSSKPKYSTQSSAFLEEGENDADHDEAYQHGHDDRKLALYSETRSTKSKSLTESDAQSSGRSSRDEVQEIRNNSRTDNRKVEVWRLTLLFLIWAIGIAVSYVTYHFMAHEEVIAFNIAYDQFSEAVEDAAIQQQLDIREAYRTFGTIISNNAVGANLTWPFVSLPLFESYGKHIIKISGTEFFSVFPVVTRDNQDAWLNFTNQNYESMVKEGHMIESGSLDGLNESGYHPYFTRQSPDGFIPDIDREVYYPGWHHSPPPSTYGHVNWNLQSVPAYANIIEAITTLKYETLLTGVRKYAGGGSGLTEEEHAQMHSEINDSSADYPHSFVFHPIHLNAEDPESPVVAFTASAMAWDFSLMHLLPDGVIGILAVLKNNCGQTFSYKINGPDALYLGMEDFHDEEYDAYEHAVDLALHTNPFFESTPGHCQFTMHIYPGTEFARLYLTSMPLKYSLGVAGCFGTMILVFYIYNWFVHKRNERLIANAARSNAVVTALFPENIRNKLIGENNPRSFHDLFGTASDPTTDLTRPPLADYFANVTVMYADIAGFTAWSSVREPPQVFALLEAVYGSFDRLCKRSKVFKVETVGDSYIAATGIPDYSPDHAVRMVLFAHKISLKMSKLTKILETTLGPDTGDLLLRIGIGTGPVTAGVIRGEKARFQLFGDTMNVAKNMESTGIGGRIQVSRETAESLRSCGKGHWLVRRDEGTVVVKGKGEIETFWIRKVIEHQKITTARTAKSDSASETSTSERASERKLFGPSAEKLSNASGREDRLVEWNVTVFLEILQQIVARREAYASASHEMEFVSAHDLAMASEMNSDFRPLDEVREIISLPKFDKEVAQSEQDPHTIEIPCVVISELRQFISTISGVYRSNPFHNFEHASHVTMSVIKLLSRIKAPTDLDMMENDHKNEEKNDIHAQTLHDHTYGITSDPLTQFACAFAALVHDVDHEGVPNAQLVKEQATIATLYDNRSVAEQNSLVIAWNLFMGDRFTNLREYVCSTPAELSRFRKLVVNAVMATDIVDKELKQLRNNRWDKAFKPGALDVDADNRDSINRKATIVIEHLIQASDISHTMQHWHVYRKWNERLFRENYAAYRAGRCETDPALIWYKGEIGFFDFYIIPLAKKLESCGVFGKSSDEFLNYARSNREEWESRGEDVVKEIMDDIKREESSSEACLG